MRSKMLNYHRMEGSATKVRRGEDDFGSHAPRFSVRTLYNDWFLMPFQCFPKLIELPFVDRFRLQEPGHARFQKQAILFDASACHSIRFRKDSSDFAVDGLRCTLAGRGTLDIAG